MASSNPNAEALPSDGGQDTPSPAQSQTASRKPSANQPLRHGRKPIYPDSDAEAEGLNAQVTDEEIETGLVPSNGDHERSSLLSTTARNGKASNAYSFSLIDRVRSKLPKSLGGLDPRLIRRRNQRRAFSSSSSTTPSPRHSTSFSGTFTAWWKEHPIVARTVYAILGLILAILILIGIEVAHLLLSTLSAPSQLAQDRILDESLLLKGPDHVQLLNISDDGILVRVDARLGLDPDHALDLWLGEKGKQGWWKNRERKLIEWGMGKVAGVQVDVGEVRLAEIGAQWAIDSEEPLLESSCIASSLTPQDMLSFHLDPLVLPVPPLNRKITDGDHDSDVRPPILGNHSTPAARHNMSPLNLTVLLKPVSPAPYILNYVENVIKTGTANLDVKIRSLRVRGLGKKELGGVTQSRKSSWFDVPRRIDISQRLIRSPVSEPVPKLDNDTNTEDLLQLDGYEFFEIGQDEDGGKHKESVQQRSSLSFTDLAMRALGIRAKAVAKNPLGSMLKGHVGYSLPFGIYLPVNDNNPPKNVTDGSADLPNSVLMAAVASEPFDLTGKKKINLDIVGRVVPPPEDSKPKLQQADESAHSDQLVFSSGPGAIPSESDDGTKTPAAPAEDNPQQIALSNFLSRFLRGEANTVYVRGGSPFSKPSQRSAPAEGQGAELPGGGSVLPAWMDNALRLLDLPISFPGSKVTDLIKNVTIQDLKITPHPFEKDKLLCSGTVMGEMNLPGQLSTIDVKITHLWPDILVFDGKPPSMKHGHGGDGDDDDDDDYDLTPGRSTSGIPALDALWNTLGWAETKGGSNGDDEQPEPEPAPPLPNPLPPKAFGRVRPYNFAPATTFLDPNDPTGQTKLLKSELKDVPFNVLPGRGPIFRGFTWKLLTGQGALAGIEGSSRAKIWNSGLGTLQLRNLPVKGAFTVGKRD